jgi:paired amphipathic helix protein Sin3a
VEKDRAVADASEQTWVQIETPTPATEAPKVRRKANFFANNHFYVLIRLIEVSGAQAIVLTLIRSSTRG